jgi:hypothetical protein
LHGDAKTPLLAGKFFESPHFSRNSTSPVLKIQGWVEVFSFLMAMYFHFSFNQCLVQDRGQKSGRNMTKRDEIKGIRREILM